MMYGVSIQHIYADVIPDEIPTNIPVDATKGLTAVTEVTASAPIPSTVVTSEGRVRPALPEGIRYYDDTNDHITITDDAGCPEGAFCDESTSTYAYKYPTDSNVYRGPLYNGITDPSLFTGGQRLHILRHPTHATYFRSGDDDHPMLFSSKDNGMNPWHGHSWYSTHWLRWIEHMPAPSKDHPGLLMYFQTPTKRARNIRTPIKPGKYLKKYFGDILGEEEINDLAVKWSNMASPAKLSVTQDADEIERVYKGKHNGSCMHFAHDSYDGNQHPARAYAGPDLATAYIGALDCADARCLVWPEKKLYYPKFYGDYRRMEDALQDAGYTRGREEDFIGARIQRLPYNKTFVVPYLDVGGCVEDNGEYLVISYDGINCRETEGLAHTGRTCAYDGERYPADEMTYVQDYGWVANENLHSCGEFFECSVVGDWFCERDRWDSPEDYPVSSAAVVYHSRQIFYCDATEMYYPLNIFNPVQMANGETWEQDYFNDHGVTCDFSRDNYPSSQVIYLDNGKVVADDLIDLDNPEYLAFAGLDVSVIEEVEAA